MDAVGFEVQREYYVNDAGRQMDILGTSVWLRYLGLCGESFVFPSNGYKGDYIMSISQSLVDEYGERFCHSAATVFAEVIAEKFGRTQCGQTRNVEQIRVRARDFLVHAREERRRRRGSRR